MAYVNPEDRVPAPPPPGQGSVPSGGQGVGGSTKAASTPGQNVPAQPSAQLSSYLAANQPQAAALGQNVAQAVGNQVNAAGQTIQPAVNTYTGNLYTVPTDANVNQAVASSPSALTPEQRATYQQELGASAHAPNSANTFETTQGYQDSAQQIQKAVEQANLWNSGNNVANLTTAMAPFEGPNATGGARSLDALLLSRTPNAYGQIQQAVAPAAGFQDQLASGTTAANQSLHNAISADTAATNAAKGSAQQYVTGLNATLNDYLNNAQQEVGQFNSDRNDLAGSLAHVQPQIANLQNAVDSYNALIAQGQNYYGVPENFNPITLNSAGQIPNTASLPNVAQLGTTQQYSNVQALLDLLGPEQLGSLNSTLIPSESGQAETWNNPGHISNVGMLLDPMISSAIHGVAPAINTLQQYSSGGQNTTNGSDENAVIGALAGTAGTIGMPPVGAGLGAWIGNNWGGDSTSSLSPNIQGNSPIGQRVRAIIDALNNTTTAQGLEAPPGARPTPPPPAGVTPPQPGQPASQAWYNYLKETYPNLSGLPATYQEYLNQFGSGGIHTV